MLSVKELMDEAKVEKQLFNAGDKEISLANLDPKLTLELFEYIKQNPPEEIQVHFAHYRSCGGSDPIVDDPTVSGFRGCINVGAVKITFHGKGDMGTSAWERYLLKRNLIDLLIHLRGAGCAKFNVEWTSIPCPFEIRPYRPT